jgi:thioredoxin-related protein
MKQTSLKLGLIAMLAVGSLLLGGCKSGQSSGGPTTGATKASGDRGKISWLTDYAAAKNAAKTSGKNLLIYFHTEWCGYCQLMEKETFSAPEIITSLNGNFVALKIDADKSPDLARQYRITGYPTTVICDQQGKPLTSIVGYQPAEQYSRSLAPYSRR